MAGAVFPCLDGGVTGSKHDSARFVLAHGRSGWCLAAHAAHAIEQFLFLVNGVRHPGAFQYTPGGI